jgi:membrane protein
MRNPSANIKKFFKQTIWKKEENKSVQKYFYKCLRILILSGKSFIDDNIFYKASTLTFYTLLSLIPFLAICFGIAQAFGIDEILTEQVKVQFKYQPEVAEKLIEFSNTTLKTTRGGIVASFGVLGLLWTVLQMIGNVEYFFNEIWRVNKARTYWQQIKRYFPLIIFLPILVAILSSISVLVSQSAEAFLKIFPFLNFLSPLVLNLLKLFSYAVSWLSLSFIYVYLPNTKVLWRTGLSAGSFTLILFSFWQWIYITFQLHASSYGAIYGSFAAVPLFLIWLNYSWLIILFGAELSRQIQEELSKPRSHKIVPKRKSGKKTTIKK